MLQQRTHVDRITEDSQIMAGKPVATGTSIPVEQVLAPLAEKPNLNALFGVFPRLTTEDVQARLAFASQKLASEQEQALTGRSDETIQKAESLNQAQRVHEEIEFDEDRFLIGYRSKRDESCLMNGYENI